MGKVDKTLFVLRQSDDILIVHVYMDDIVFGGSSHTLVERFAEDMSKEFKMSMMGKLQFFLGLQIKQAKEGTFVHQAKYTKDILKKFNMNDSKPLSTPMSTTRTLDADQGRSAREPEGVPEHDRLPLILDDDEAGHPVFCVSVRSFSGVTEDFISAGCQADLQVSSIHF
jgi:hypothetical protein